MCDCEDNELKVGKEYIFEICVIVFCGFGVIVILKVCFGKGEGEYCFFLVWFFY